jgi:hypothetical protein
MAIATRRSEDSPLVREMLELLVRVDGLAPMSAEQVRAIYQITRNRLADVSQRGDQEIVKDEGAAVRDMGHLSGTLISRRLTLTEGRMLLGEFLSAIDDARFGNKIVKVILSMLIGLAHRDSDAISWMEEVFGNEHLANVVQLAIARAMLQVDGNHIGGHAWRLKDRPDCPPEVATYIVTRLQQ